MYKLVAADLDETLLDDDHQVPRRCARAIRAAREKGVRFVPATGRPAESVVAMLEELGLNCAGEYTISFNGGYVSENATGRVLRTTSLDRDRAEALYERGLGFDVCMHVYTPTYVYVYNYTDVERHHIQGRMNIVETDGSTLDFIGDEPVVKMLYMNPDVGYLEQLAQEVADLTEGLDVCYSSNRYLEFNSPGVNKGAGLLALAAELGIAQEETIAIGDNSNDIAMIRAAGLGAAVANATAETKAAAGYVCEADNNAGGVAEVIERFVLGA